MCRLLLVKSKEKFNIADHLRKFAQISKNSKEFQGHGWGCSYLDENNDWKFYKNIKPIWEDDLDQFGKTNLLIAHARSAFQDKGIVVENNMPFHDDKYVFIFNGELKGVRIKEEGRIGAEKIFNFIKRFDKGDMKEALEKAIEQIKKRTKYYKAINIIIADKEKIYAANNFNEQPDYFTMHVSDRENAVLIVCSDPYPDEEDWKELEKNKVVVF